MINPFLNWAEKIVYNQIKNCLEKGYLNDTFVDDETGEVILYNICEHKRLKKLMKKIIREKTFDDEKKQFAIRKICNNVISFCI